MTGPHRVAYLIACSAPPVLDLAQFLSLLRGRGWNPYVILTPTAATWVEVDELVDASGHPVRVQPRTPADQDPLPPADAVVAAPLTFNSLNKWAAGISDTLALGLLNETLGLGLPIITAPCIKAALRQHPAYPRSVERLTAAGVTMLDPELVVVPTTDGPTTFDWTRVLPPDPPRPNRALRS